MTYDFTKPMIQPEFKTSYHALNSSPFQQVLKVLCEANRLDWDREQG